MSTEGQFTLKYRKVGELGVAVAPLEQARPNRLKPAIRKTPIRLMAGDMEGYYF